MGRPRKNSKEEPVRERIKQAFWELYKTRPIEQICIKEICSAAACNKTTFYYHFANTAEVLAEIERDCHPAEIPILIVRLLSEDKLDLGFIESFVAANEARIETVRILLGPNGDTTFRHRVEEEIVDLWCEAMGIDHDKLEKTDRLFIRFAIGGAVSLYAKTPDQDEPFDYLATFELASRLTIPYIKLMISKYQPSKTMPDLA